MAAGGGNGNDYFANLPTSKFASHSRYITDILKREGHGLPIQTRLYEYQVEAVLETARHFGVLPREGAEERPYAMGNGNTPAPKMALIVAPPGSGKSGR